VGHPAAGVRIILPPYGNTMIMMGAAVLV
jgi:hypothetical protein